MTTLAESQQAPSPVEKTPRHASAPPGRSFRLLRHSISLARRSLIKTIRTPEQLLDVTLQPVIFVVLFVYLLGGAISGSRHEYLQFLLPAIMVQTVAFAALATGVSLNTDIKKGVFDRFRSLPIARWAPLAGAIMGDVTRYVISVIVSVLFFLQVSPFYQSMFQGGILLLAVALGSLRVLRVKNRLEVL